MNPFRCALVLALLIVSAISLQAQEEGIAPRWDVREQLGVLIEQSKRFDPLLEQLHPQEWVQKGAPESYAGQLEALKNEIGYLRRTAEELQQKPDQLTKTLEAFLRLQAVESMMGSMIEAVARYQNPATADLLTGIADEVAPYGQNLRTYLVDLVASKEAELAIANQEAQRCRSQLIQSR